jgi:hypothetical protein
MTSVANVFVSMQICSIFFLHKKADTNLSNEICYSDKFLTSRENKKYMEQETKKCSVFR